MEQKEELPEDVRLRIEKGMDKKYWIEREGYRKEIVDLKAEVEKWRTEAFRLQAEVKKWKERFNHPEVIEHRADMAKEIAELREALKVIYDTIFYTDEESVESIFPDEIDFGTIKDTFTKIGLNSGTESRKE